MGLGMCATSNVELRPVHFDPHDLLDQLARCDADLELAEVRSGAAVFLGALFLAGSNEMNRVFGTMLRHLRTERESLWVQGRPLPDSNSVEGRRIELITKIEQALQRLRKLPMMTWSSGDQLRARNAIYLYARTRELARGATIERDTLRAPLAGRTVKALFELIGDRPIVWGRVRRRTVTAGYTMQRGRVVFCLVNRYRRDSSGHAELVFSPTATGISWSKVLD